MILTCSYHYLYGPDPDSVRALGSCDEELVADIMES